MALAASPGSPLRMKVQPDGADGGEQRCDLRLGGLVGLGRCGRAKGGEPAGEDQAEEQSVAPKMPHARERTMGFPQLRLILYLRYVGPR